jgi:aminopeptidase N
VEINKARETDEIFDEISYYKGSRFEILNSVSMLIVSVLKMVWAYIGEENFRKGLNVYLKRFLYKNAITTGTTE